LYSWALAQKSQRIFKCSEDHNGKPTSAPTSNVQQLSQQAFNILTLIYIKIVKKIDLFPRDPPLHLYFATLQSHSLSKIKVNVTFK